MFSIIDIADMHRKHYHRALSKKCERSICKSPRDFVKKYGSIPINQCDFTEAYNEVVNSKGDDLKTYVIGDTLWSFVDECYLREASEINLMLLVYVLSQHCGEKYKGLSYIGFWNKEYDVLTIMTVSDISLITLEAINYNYIGYINSDVSWDKSDGTNKSILYEAVEHFKNSRKYKPILADFKYEDSECKVVARFDMAVNTPMLLEMNKYLAAPVKYGGNEFERILINYVSDVHVGHHIDFTMPLIPQIRRMVRDLSNTQGNGIVFFGGDIATNRNICLYFYKEYMTRRWYVRYKAWKQNNEYIPSMSPQDAEIKLTTILSKLYNQKTDEVSRICPWYKYTKRAEDKNLDEMNSYVNSSYFKKKYPAFVGIRLMKIKRIEYDIAKYEARRETYLEEFQNGSGEKKFNKTADMGVFAVLGNHEMSDFLSVQEAVAFYGPRFEALGIHFLNNNIICNERAVVVGGCGFAKYNQEFNATNTLNAKSFTRADEIRETNKFEKLYHEALDEAKAEHKPLIVLAHFPTKDWLENDECDSQAVYFTGHTHKNMCECAGQRYIYADNQIGYNKKSLISFKTAKLGTVPNPFIDFEDGCYKITTDQYCDFYRYNGDPLSGVAVINNMLRNGGHFYMIKHIGFYGFFFENKSNEISICVGGKTKKIAKKKSIGYIMDNFDSMVNVYLTALLPFRKAQEQISSELQEMGLSGVIHGCIVDVDFFYHMMLNPLDGTITYYYSPMFGTLQTFKTFPKMLKHMHLDYLNESPVGAGQITKTGNQLSKASFQTSDEVKKMETIDIKNSIYSLSSRINQLQRLFTSRVLREWNDSLIK